MNSQNLKPFTSSQSREKAVRNGRKGGLASGAARRKKKALRTALEELMNSRVSDIKDPRRKESIQNILGREDGTMGEVFATRLFLKALSGDTRAMQIVLDTMGESLQAQSKATELQLRAREIQLKEQAAAPPADDGKPSAMQQLVESLKRANEERKAVQTVLVLPDNGHGPAPDTLVPAQIEKANS